MTFFLAFFLILMLAGVPALVLGWVTPDSFDKGYSGGQWQPIPQSHDDEVLDDDDEEKEDDDYD